MAWSGFLAPQPLTLAPCFVNNDCVTGEITYSTVHVYHKILDWSQATLCSTPVWASLWKPWLLLHQGYTGAISWVCYTRLCYGSVMVMLWLLLWLLCQSGERLCYGCHASQEKINVSAVPVAPWVSFQPLSSCLAYPGFSKQCKLQYKFWPRMSESSHLTEICWYICSLIQQILVKCLKWIRPGRHNDEWSITLAIRRLRLGRVGECGKTQRTSFV